jgi:predicted DNA-binding mobile mystery protein A
MRASAPDLELLDRRLSPWKEIPAAMPPRGWFRAIREALGMPRDEVARRLGVTKQAIGKLEASEANGSIRLETLRRAAQALECTLVYALVPNSSLEDVVEGRARAVARRDLERASHTMILEAQGGGRADEERLLEELAEQAKRSSFLWHG